MRFRGADARGFAEAASTAIPRFPRLNRAGFAFLGHGLRFAFDKAAKRASQNEALPPNLPGLEATLGHGFVKRGFSQARRLHGIRHAEGNGFHVKFSVSIPAELRGWWRDEKIMSKPSGIDAPSLDVA